MSLCPVRNSANNFSLSLLNLKLILRCYSIHPSPVIIPQACLSPCILSYMFTILLGVWGGTGSGLIQFQQQVPPHSLFPLPVASVLPSHPSIIFLLIGREWMVHQVRGRMNLYTARGHKISHRLLMGHPLFDAL